MCQVDSLELGPTTPQAVFEHTKSLTMEQTLYASGVALLMLIHMEHVSIYSNFGPRVDEILSGIYDGFLDRFALRWLLHIPLSPGIMRTVLLWILDICNCFGLRSCLHCGVQFQSQGHTYH